MVLLFIPDSPYTFEEKVQQLNRVRLGRSCVEGSFVGDGEVEGHPFLDSYLPFTFAIQIGIIAAGILVIILLLGVIKGLMGLCLYSPIGMLGLGYLVDIPRVLDKYQENELTEMKVVYDSVGWPIHPQTAKRTVRAVSKRTEFCANVIFFIAFPLVIIITILSACFSHKTYDEDDGGECYQKVNTIMLSDTPSLKLLAKGCTTKGVGGSHKTTGKGPCPSKSPGSCSKDCKYLTELSSTTNSKSKSSSSGKIAVKSSKSSLKSDTSAKNNKSKPKSSAAKASRSKSKSSAKSNKSKNSKSKVSGKRSNPKKVGKTKSPVSKSAYKDDDSAEDADTQYVLDQMHESEMSLKK